MAKSTHSPLPWVLTKKTVEDRRHITACDEKIVACTLYSWRDQNAAFIVRAVNSHAALVEALGKLLWLNSTQGVTEEEYEAAEQAGHAALTLAKGA